MPRNLYTALFCLLLPVYFARLCCKGLYNKEYFLRWSERLGYSTEIPSKDKSIIWIHAVSVGEVNASMSLLRSLIDDYPYSEILVTTNTPTGSKLLIERLGNKIKHQYLPVDIPFFINSFLNKWNPKILILLETEIWPNLINICKSRGIYSALVNARLSEKSKKNYLSYSTLIKPVIEKIDLILAQFESDKRRFQEIVERKDINTCGNLKFDQDVPTELEDISKSIKQDWSIDGKYRPTLIAASTHETEEEKVLKAFKQILKSSPNALLILVPRHLERFDKVKKLINTSGLILASRSKKDEVKKSTQVLLGDTIGELNMFYSLANIVFIGGSLVPHGGQNPIEAAYLGKKIYHGKNIDNFIDVYDVLNQLKFTQQVENERQLEHYVKEALAKPKSINKDININRLKKEGDDTVSKVLKVIYQYL